MTKLLNHDKFFLTYPYQIFYFLSYLLNLLFLFHRHQFRQKLIFIVLLFFIFLILLIFKVFLKNCHFNFYNYLVFITVTIITIIVIIIRNNNTFTITFANLLIKIFKYFIRYKYLCDFKNHAFLLTSVLYLYFLHHYIHYIHHLQNHILH